LLFPNTLFFFNLTSLECPNPLPYFLSTFEFSEFS
jgi:hypothetical protein